MSSSSYVVDLSLDASQVASVKVGQPVAVTLVTSTSSATGFRGFAGGAAPGGADHRPGPDLRPTARATPARSSGTTAATGTVTSVASVADASSGVAKYAVVVSFTDTSGSYNAGASVSVAVTYAQTGDTLSVPVRAVTTTNGTSTVEVSSGGGTESRTVTTGITANGMVQITSGLSAGEQVVVRGPGGQNRTTPSTTSQNGTQTSTRTGS